MKTINKLGSIFGGIIISSLAVTGCTAPDSAKISAAIEDGVVFDITDSVNAGSNLSLLGFAEIPSTWNYSSGDTLFSATNEAGTCQVNSEIIETDYLGMGLGDAFLTNYTFQKSTTDYFDPESAVLSKMEIPALSDKTQFLTYEFTSVGDLWNVDEESGNAKIEENIKQQKFVAARGFDTAVQGTSEGTVSPVIFLTASCTDNYNLDEIKSIFNSVLVQDKPVSKDPDNGK